MFSSVLQRLRPSAGALARLCSTAPEAARPETEVTPRQIAFPPKYQKLRHVWLENINTIDVQRLGILELHPDIFGTAPRIDIVHQNVQWQKMYRFVSFAHSKVRAEVRGGGRKPWPQKGLGRARHGSIRSPLFRGGGIAHGPRSPTSYFYMLPFYSRLLGLTTMLSIKLAQDDLRIITDLDIPTDEPQYIQELIEARQWGPSVLIVDESDIMPRNISLATDAIKHVNLMPVYGLNVYSMLKHDTLVLTRAAVDEIESKLLFNLNRIDGLRVMDKFRMP